jgi:hypothetical protein
MSRAGTRDCADGYAPLLAVTIQIDPPSGIVSPF